MRSNTNQLDQKTKAILEANGKEKARARFQLIGETMADLPGGYIVKCILACKGMVDPELAIQETEAEAERMHKHLGELEERVKSQEQFVSKILAIRRDMESNFDLDPGSDKEYLFKELDAALKSVDL